MSQTPHEAKESVADTLNDPSENPRAPGQHETDVARRQAREQAQQGMPAFGLLGPAGCLGVLSGAAPLSEVPDQPEE